MRIKKFRIWNKRRNEFIYPEDGDYNYTDRSENGGLGYFLITQNGVVQCNDGIFLDDWHENYEVHDYVGQQDRNGNDIYEGDILRLGNNGNQEAVVKWYESSSQFKCQIKSLNPSPSNFSGLKYIGVSQAAKRGCEIIGNIYQ